MSKNVAVKDFELHKIKFNAKKGLDIEFFDINSPNELWSVSSDSQPSEDYINALNELKEVFAYSLSLNNGWDFAREHNRKNEEALKKARQFWLDEIERCSVTGLTVVGAGDSLGIKISGSLKTELGVVGCASPTIRFDVDVVNSIDESVMIGDLAETAFNKIREEIWMFIFKGKRGGELFPAEEKIESGLNGVVTMSKVG
jgi:hypothetical protein